MDNGCLDSGGGTAAPADADAGVDAVLSPGERAQHPHGVSLVLRLAEHLALALDHRVKAADDVIGVFLGHSAGLGSGQSLGEVRRGIRRDLRLVHVAGDDSIVGGDKGHQLTPARTAGGKDQSHSVLPFWSIIKSRSVQSLPKQGVSRNFRKRALPEGSLPPALRRHLPRRGRQGALGPLCEGAPPTGGGGEDLAANAVYFPVDPNPPAPRAVSVSSSAGSNAACQTGAMQSWATRSPGWMV